MEMGTFLPLILGFFALTEVPLFLSWRRSGRISEGAANLMIVLSLAFPFIAYLVLNTLLPDVGAIEVF